MLCLKRKTNSKWIVNALADFSNIIIDHAHCEKKAAFTGMSLLNKYPEKIELSLVMSDLVREEIDHYKSVILLLKQREIVLTKDRGDDYAKKLFTNIRKSEPQKLLDHLLIAGIIEARSTERLQLLAENISDKLLKDFYNKLVVSEAGHYTAFVKLAKLYFSSTEVSERLDELSFEEASIVKNLSNIALMHG